MKLRVRKLFPRLSNPQMGDLLHFFPHEDRQNCDFIRRVEYPRRFRPLIMGRPALLLRVGRYIRRSSKSKCIDLRGTTGRKCSRVFPG